MLLLTLMIGKEARLFSVIGMTTILLLLIIELFRKIFRTNRIIESLLSSIRHGDVNKTILEQAGGLGFRELADSAQLIVRAIASARIEKEVQYRYLRTLLEHIHTAVITLDEKGEPELVNPLALKTLGIYHTRKPSWKEIEKAAPRFAETVLQMGAAGREMLPLTGSMAGRALLILVNSVKIGGRSVTIVTFQDIEPEIEQKEMESWYTISRIMAHEIMNSLTPLSSLTETGIMMLEDNGSSRQVHSLTQQTIDNLLQALRTISDRNRALTRFIGNYRQLSRLPPPETEMFPVADLLRELRDLYRQEGETRGIPLIIRQGPASHLHIRADRAQIKQVLINLIKNGMEALEDAPEPQLLLSVKRVLDHCHIEVSDNGPGIPPEQIDKIFVPFYSTKPEGSGIGLSLSRQIIHNHQGQLTAHAEQHRGSLFRISLPVEEPSPNH
jgi:two-component system nitrogen regulation sensor histidine kinase NtrY